MAILNDSNILTRCSDGMIHPFTEAMVNPASIDVRIGYSLIFEAPEERGGVTLPLHCHSEQEPCSLLPGAVALVSTLEMFNFPANIAGEFRLKSSLAREKLALAGAEFADPGWHGSVATLQIKNNSQHHPVLLWPGRPFAQLILHELVEPAAVSYAVTGRYNGDTKAQGSRG